MNKIIHDLGEVTKSHLLRSHLFVYPWTGSRDLGSRNAHHPNGGRPYEMLEL